MTNFPKPLGIRPSWYLQGMFLLLSVGPLAAFADPHTPDAKTHTGYEASYSGLSRLFGPEDRDKPYDFVTLEPKEKEHVGTCYADTANPVVNKLFLRSTFKVVYKPAKGLDSKPEVRFMSDDVSNTQEYEDETLRQKVLDRRESHYEASGTMGGLSRKMDFMQATGKINDGAEHFVVSSATINHFTRKKELKGGKHVYVMKAIALGEPFRHDKKRDDGSTYSDIGATPYYCVFEEI